MVILHSVNFVGPFVESVIATQQNGLHERTYIHTSVQFCLFVWLIDLIVVFGRVVYLYLVVHDAKHIVFLFLNSHVFVGDYIILCCPVVGTYRW